MEFQQFLIEMEKQKTIQNFVLQKIKQIDVNYNKQPQDMNKLKMATMRASYAKIMQTFTKDQTQLPKSYYEQSKIYLKNNKIDQAISRAQLAKRKLLPSIQTQEMKILKQNIDLLLVQCYYKSKKCEDALSIIQQIQISNQENKQKYLALKGEIYQSLENQQKSRESYKLLYQLTVRKYGNNSLQSGLCMIQMGKNIGYFKNNQEGINLINQGMEILITHRYHNPDRVAQIYQTLAQLSKQVEDFQKQYSSLICAYSMIKQLQENQEKRSIQVLNKLSTNLLKRDQKQKALQFLCQVQQIQRKIYGQSSVSLGKTVKKIISLLLQLNRLGEVRKYENQYEHLIGSRVVANGKLDNSAINTSHFNDKKSHHNNSISRCVNVN